MRRSICCTEPTAALAGEVNTWKFVYTTSTNLPKGTILLFDIGSKGRTTDWQTPNTDLKKNKNVIWAVLENKKVLQAKAIESAKHVVPQFEFILPQEVPAGKTITICMGCANAKQSATHGNMAQLTIQRRRPFMLYVDPTKKRKFEEPEMFSIDIKGNTLHAVRILAPSITVKNRRFDVVLRFEDEHGNLTSNAPADTLIELTHGNLRENLKWTLFIPETGFTTLPNLYFNEAGVYTIELKNMKTKEIFRSSPIKCLADEEKNLFWGSLHGESERFDSTENIESCLRHFRDEKSMNFYATSSFENSEETSNDIWKRICQNLEDFNEEDRFAAMLGFQWVGETGKEGVRQILFAKGEKPLLRKKESRSSTLKKIYRLFSPKECISIPSFTMAKGYHFDFKEFDPEFERVVEIYNAWGASDHVKKEGNTRPIEGDKKKGIEETAEGSIINALLANKRFGFVAGGLDDRGIYSELYDIDQAQYSPGLTAVLAESLSRNAIFEALYNRHCYATTGERIIVGLSIAGLPMGSEISTEKKPGLVINRHIVGYVAGTGPLKSVTLIRNAKALKTYTPKGNNLDFEYDDMAPLKDHVINTKDGKPPFVFYYLRVVQEDGHIAWSSPIWIDLIASSKQVVVKKK